MVNEKSQVLAVLLEGLFDYAGLFPPANLCLNDAVKEFNQLVESSIGFTIQKFVCPVGKLDLFAESWKIISSEPASLSVLGTSYEAISQDLKAIDNFLVSNPQIAEIVSYEVKSNADSKMSKAIAKQIQNSGIEKAYIELQWGEKMTEQIHDLASTEFFSAKARTGGIDPNLFPNSNELAGFLYEAMNVDLEFKLTAGLHHALPYVDSMQCHHHGLLNVLVVTSLIASEDLSIREVIEILETKFIENPSSSADKISFGEYSIDSEMAEIGRSYFDSIGSCSITEPVESLTNIGLN